MASKSFLLAKKRIGSKKRRHQKHGERIKLKPFEYFLVRRCKTCMMVKGIFIFFNSKIYSCV